MRCPLASGSSSTRVWLPFFSLVQQRGPTHDGVAPSLLPRPCAASSFPRRAPSTPACGELGQLTDPSVLSRSPFPGKSLRPGGSPPQLHAAMSGQRISLPARVSIVGGSLSRPHGVSSGQRSSFFHAASHRASSSPRPRRAPSSTRLTVKARSSDALLLPVSATSSFFPAAFFLR